jgi:hypothetical protein
VVRSEVKEPSERLDQRWLVSRFLTKSAPVGERMFEEMEKKERKKELKRGSGMVLKDFEYG